MKRWMAMLAAALTMVLFAESGTRLEQLKPVGLLYLTQTGNQLTLRTDGGDTGRGDTLDAAAEDLCSTSPGRIFLNTTEMIIVTEKTLWTLPQLQKLVRPAAQICLGVGPVAPKEAAEYLQVHDPDITIGEICRGEGRIPVLRGERGRYWLEP